MQVNLQLSLIIYSFFKQVFFDKSYPKHLIKVIINIVLTMGPVFIGNYSSSASSSLEDSGSIFADVGVSAVLLGYEPGTPKSLAGNISWSSSSGDCVL